MKVNKGGTNRSSASDLRKKAEQLHSKKLLNKKTTPSKADTQKLIHELEVHQIQLELQQIELEMQNDELELLKASNEEAKEKYIELYDFAPTAYFTLSQEGEIIDLNLQASQMLGKERAHLHKSSLGFFISDATKKTYNQFLEAAFETNTKQTCEVCISKNGNSPVYIHLSGIVKQKNKQCFISATDITKRKLAELHIQEDKIFIESITNLSSDSLYVYDLLLKKNIYSNQTIQKILGYSVDELKEMGDTIVQTLMHPDDYQIYIIETYPKYFALEDKLTLSHKYRMRDVNGKWCWLLAREIIYKRLQNGTPWQIFGTIQDIDKEYNDEQALKKSEARFRSLFENAYSGIAICSLVKDKEGRGIDIEYLQVNKATQKHIALRPEQMIGKRISELLTPIETVDYIKKFESVTEKGEPIYFEQNFTAYGKILDIGAFKIENDIFAIRFTDITKRKKDEEELKLLTETLLQERNLFTEGPVAVFKWKNAENLQVEYVSENIYGVLGYSVEDFRSGKISYYGLILKEDRIRVANEIVLASANDKYSFYHEPYQIRCENGKNIWVDNHTTIIRNYKGEITHFLGYIVNITKRKQAELKLKKSEKKHRTYIENAPEGIYVSDALGNLIDVNPAGCKMLGYTLEELLKMSILDLVLRKYVEKTKETFMEVRQKGKIRMEAKFYKKDGATIIMSLAAVSLSNERFMAFCTDITKQKEIEDQLVENQYYLTKAQEIGKIGTWQIDIKSNHIKWTGENYKIFGVESGAEVDYNIFLNCVHPGDRNYVNESWNKALKHVPYDIEHRIIVDNEEKWVREKADIEFDTDGKATLAIGFTQDITERKKGEEALRISEEKYRTITETAVDSIISINADGLILSWNAAAEKMFGYKASEITGKGLGEIISLQQLSKPIAKVKRFSFGAERMIGEVHEFTAIKKDGSEFFIELSLSMWKRNNQKFYTGILRDISERKKMEESISQSEERFRQITENSQEWIWEINSEGLYTFSSHVLEDTLGYKNEEIVGKKFFYDLFIPENRGKQKKKRLVCSIQKNHFGIL